MKFFSFTDTYGVDISHGEDEITILAAVIIIDLVKQHKRNN